MNKVKEKILDKKELILICLSIVFILMLIIGMIIILGTLYVLNGSLEMYPNAEQQEKARIAGGTIVLMGFIAEFYLAKKL